jgi:hypothetical protein
VDDQGQQVVPGRAAVAAASYLSRNIDSASNNTFFAKERVEMGAAVGLLPPGVSAGAVGRSALIVGQHYWTEAGLGARQDVRFHAPVWTHQLLHWAGRERNFGQGPQIVGPLDIPVWVEPATGRIVQVDVDRMVAEMEPQFDVAKRIWKEEEAPLSGARTVAKAPGLAKGLLRRIKEEVSDVVGDIKGIGESTAPPLNLGGRPTDAECPPIEGVGYRTWVEVTAGLQRDEVHPTHLDAYTAHRGVPAGRWSSVDGAWASRAAGNARLTAWRDFDVAHLAQLGARWMDG